MYSIHLIVQLKKWLLLLLTNNSLLHWFQRTATVTKIQQYNISVMLSQICRVWCKAYSRFLEVLLAVLLRCISRKFSSLKLLTFKKHIQYVFCFPTEKNFSKETLIIVFYCYASLTLFYSVILLRRRKVIQELQKWVLQRKLFIITWAQKYIFCSK